MAERAKLVKTTWNPPARRAQSYFEWLRTIIGKVGRGVKSAVYIIA
jgi:hypothetical protein